MNNDKLKSKNIAKEAILVKKMLDEKRNKRMETEEKSKIALDKIKKQIEENKRKK